MVAWMLGAFASPMVLPGLEVRLRYGPRRHGRLTCDQIPELEVLAGLGWRENRNRPTLDHQRAGRLPAPGTAAMASPAPGPADLLHRRQLEKPVAWSGRERLRRLWYRLLLTVAEMNYAIRRIVELQAPWIADDRAASDGERHST